MWTKVGCSKTLQNLEELKTLFQFLTFYPHWLLSTWTDLSPNWRRVRLGTEISCRWGLVPQSCPALCDPQGLQHPRLPCPSLTPRVWSTSCPLSQRCHPTISSSAIPFSSLPSIFPASQFFPVSWLFTSGGQSTETSASASVLPMNIQGWFPKSFVHRPKWEHRIIFSVIYE